MDSNHLNCYQSSPSPTPDLTSHRGVQSVQENCPHHRSHARKLSQTMVEMPDPDSLSQLKSGKVWIVSKKRRNGLIVYKRCHSEFAGPGAAVGGICDSDCHGCLPMGNLELVLPQSPEELYQAYLTRIQWTRLLHGITSDSVPIKRAQKILQNFEGFFGAKTVSSTPDEAFALMVGVIPETVHEARLLS